MKFTQIVKYGLLTGASFFIMQTANGQNNATQSNNTDRQTYTRTCETDSFVIYTYQAKQDYKSGNYNKAFYNTQNALKHSKNASDSSITYENMAAIAATNLKQSNRRDSFYYYTKQTAQYYNNNNYDSAFAYATKAEKSATNAQDSVLASYNSESIKKAANNTNSCGCYNCQNGYYTDNTGVGGAGAIILFVGLGAIVALMADQITYK